MNKIPSLHSQKFVNDSYAFLQKQLEILDPKIMEPLTGTDWPRDIPVKTGGGFVENVNVVDVTYASTGRDEDSLFVENGNDIPVIQADFSDNPARMFNFKEYMRIGYVEQQKFKKLAYSLEDTLNKGVRLHLDKVIDRNVYRGISKANTTGLINNPRIVRISAATNASNATTWASKTADEILNDINTIISAIWTACDCASDALPNHILIPVEQFGSLVMRRVSDDSERSILTYVLENNLTNQQGGNLVISPSKWCKGAGTARGDRMVCYINHIDRVRFTQTVPLQRLQTEIRNMSFDTPFVSQFSEVQFLYPQTVRYMDGI